MILSFPERNRIQKCLSFPATRIHFVPIMLPKMFIASRTGLSLLWLLPACCVVLSVAFENVLTTFCPLLGACWGMKGRSDKVSDLIIA
jgi:hypothetical protein